ncbi:separin [Venturia canescens]|uniref:separin n=1 Tax=Venturia canescens TaxID=32260 RepID=UPI001C9C1033|nr:separin [Venturia canescens]
MALYVDKITTLFRECKILENQERQQDKKLATTVQTHKTENEGKTFRRIEYNHSRNHHDNLIINLEDVDSQEILFRNIQSFVSTAKIRTANVEFSYLNKMLAMSCLANGDEMTAIEHLIESHAVILKQHIYHRYTKTLVRREFLNELQESGLKPAHTKFDPDSGKGQSSLRARLAEMPKEWYMVQITAGYKDPYSLKGNDSVLDTMIPLHLTIFPTGKGAIDPFRITLPKPKNEESQGYDGLNEIVKIQKNNKADLEAYYASNKCYWKMREAQNNRMKTAVKELEYTWLREWRVLLVADPLEESPLAKEMGDMIDKLIADDLTLIAMSSRSRWLLKKIATSSHFLSKVEIARAVHYVLCGNNKLANNIILSIDAKLKTITHPQTEKRKTLVIIVDECIDHVPFETMDVLVHHPVTRFPSFHIAYAMFKEHEDTIVKGCKIVKNNKELGTFIVNPARNLERLEKRMKLFINYWLPNWKGKYGMEPEENIFENILVNKDVLMYSGHGSGIQYLPGEKIERLRVRAIVLLFGCSSVKLYPTGGRFPPYGISNQYLIACSPCMLGMLWEVTDGDIDRMTARFMSEWIPSDPGKSWSNVDINKWCEGILKFKTPSTGDSNKASMNEPELLRAVAKSKEVCTQHMTSAAIIVRGLPIRLE